MDGNADECPVCLTAYNDTTQRPRTIPCGHTFCTACINGLIKEQGPVTCPTCRREHVVPEVGEFPVSYTIEALIRRLRGATSALDEFMKSVTESSQNGQTGLSKTIRFKLQEQEAKALATIRTCREVQTQLSQYQTTLVDWNERQQNLEDRLQSLVAQSKGARVLVQQEESNVVGKKEQVQQGEQQLQALLQTLRTVTTDQEAEATSIHVARCIDMEKQRAEECRRLFPDVHTVTTISKVWEASNAALEAAATFQAAREKEGARASATEDHDLLTSPDTSIVDRLQTLLTPTLHAEDLRNLTQPARSLLRAGLVFAIHHQKGRSRHASISLEDGRLFLHSLQDQPLPSRAVTLQMDEMVPVTLPCLVFLDLEWPGSALRRVLVRLSPDTPRGRQFLLLCTGQLGPCYANTRLWQVRNKGQPGEHVYGGDYEYNDGTGGAALLPHLDNSEYQRSRRAGVVWGAWCGVPARGAVFCITTRDRRDGGGSCVFGEVVGGLEDVIEAAKHNPIWEVIVVDCGVVLWAQ